MMKSILHNMTDKEAVSLLPKCRRSMGLNSKLILADMIMGPEFLPFTKLKDIAMLALSGGKERTIEEDKGLFGRVDLQLEKTIETGTPVRLLVASPYRLKLPGTLMSGSLCRSGTITTRPAPNSPREN